MCHEKSLDRAGSRCGEVEQKNTTAMVFLALLPIILLYGVLAIHCEPSSDMSKHRASPSSCSVL